MLKNKSIITIGLSPCWDITCCVAGIEWGDHKNLLSKTSQPAGKAMNISRALAYLNIKSTAAGLWGKTDYQQMIDEIRPVSRSINIKMTKAPGRARQNITIVDTKNKREMHLKTSSTLADTDTLKSLRKDLTGIVTDDSVCVFAGSMPTGPLMDDVLKTVKHVLTLGGQVVLDTSGEPLRCIVEQGGLSVIKPNLDELSELLGSQVEDTADAITKVASTLLDKVEIVIVSRGQKGAIAITADGVVNAKCVSSGQAIHTVGCGDYLLAGFLAGMVECGDIKFAMEKAIKTATARAWGKDDLSPVTLDAIKVSIK